jgi:hypothetical protein
MIGQSTTDIPMNLPLTELTMMETMSLITVNGLQARNNATIVQATSTSRLETPQRH